MKKRYIVFGAVALLMVLACSTGPNFSLDYDKYQLDNGLTVILHHDGSDPVTAVAIQYHVGSNREEPGKTGFAHLFEHMMFQESQHVGQDQFFKKIQSAGGSLNGGTGNDGTTYYEVVPKNALEMALWLESDRMGYLLPRMTLEAFKNQQGVVMNEKRQTTDNRPYGQTGFIIDKLLYPEGHPYSWQVIGSMEDLAGASLRDVHAFHQKWYRPNNATLVVAGDYNPATIREMIKKYFGEIESGDPVTDLEPQRVTIDVTTRVWYEDDFATSPELTMVFPTVEQYTDDAYALDMLGRLLSSGKKAPLYKVIVEEKKYAPSVSGYNSSQEIAGVFQFRIRAFPNISLTDVEKAVFEAMDRFEKEKFSEKDLARLKAGIETNFYNGISSVLGKAFQLARYNEYAGSPDYLGKDLERSLAVTSEDIWRVYNRYLKNKPYVETSFVPRGQTKLAVKGSEQYPEIEDNAEKLEALMAANTEEIVVEDIPSSFDRSVEPPIGPDPELKLPDIWQGRLANDIAIYGIQHDELPLVQFAIRLKGGMLLDEPDKIGEASLLADMLTEGTKTKTPVELEEAIDDLGARISVSAGDEAITLRANCLVSRFDEVLALAQEILFEPRWDEKEFKRLKSQAVESIKRSKINPSAVASDVFAKLVYGPGHKLAMSRLGTEKSVEKITIDDLKRYYKTNVSASVADITIAGDISRDRALRAFRILNPWQAKEVRFPLLPDVHDAEKTRLYFVDFPGARQSQIRAGHLGPAATDPDFYRVQVMNYQLGGSFNSTLNMILREEKGWTYGARSGFSGSTHPGTFMASSGVQAQFTLESLEIVRDAITGYRNGITEEQLAFTQDALIKSNARRFETLGALMGMLSDIADYDKPFNYIKKEEDIVKNMTLEQHRELAREYLHPDHMIYLVVGDASKYARRLRQLGYGRPIMLDKDGRRKE